MKNRQQVEINYWNKAAQDPSVDVKYICDIDDKESLDALGELKSPVLDLGCGVGRLMRDDYYGVDISEGMLDIARERKPYCDFKLIKNGKIPHSNNYFSTVYSVLVFQHIPFESVVNYINEAKRVLKRRGNLIFQFIEGEQDEPFSKHHNLESIKSVLLNAGFGITKIEKGLGHKLWTWVYCTKI